jgi:uncharacterized protein YjfI (DUF2170 family)
MAEIGKQGRRPMTVAERKRRQRARLQEQGLKPVEVWIPTEHRAVLRRLEQMLRKGVVPELAPTQTATKNGKEIMEFKLLRETLNGFTSENGFRFTTAEADGAVEVVVEDREEFPILVSADNEQIVCVTYLWDEAQVKEGQRTEMLSGLLEMNVPLPLSSFGKIGDRYVLFGALAANSRVEDVINELEILSDNTLEAIEAVAPFLN